jgi:hypothetical protein
VVEAFAHSLKQIGESGFVIADNERLIGLALRLRGLCGIGAHADGDYLFSMMWLSCTTISDPGGIPMSARRVAAVRSSSLAIETSNS